MPFGGYWFSYLAAFAVPSLFLSLSSLICELGLLVFRISFRLPVALLRASIVINRNNRSGHDCLLNGWLRLARVGRIHCPCIHRAVLGGLSGSLHKFHRRHRDLLGEKQSALFCF